jgi:hypothetical protein
MAQIATTKPLAYWLKLAAKLPKEPCRDCNGTGEDRLGRTCLCVAFERELDYTERYDR